MGGETEELATRSSNGVVVSLLWHRAENELTVLVDDTLTGEQLSLRATGENALEVFNHPFAYAERIAA